MALVVFIEIFGGFHFMRFVMAWQRFSSSPSFLTPQMQDTVSKDFKVLVKLFDLVYFAKFLSDAYKSKYDET